MLSPGRFQHCSLVFNDFFFYLLPRAKRFIILWGVVELQYFLSQSLLLRLQNGTCRVTNIISSSYTFLFLKPSDNHLFVLMCACSALRNYGFSTDQILFQFSHASCLGGTLGGFGLEIVLPLYPKIFVSCALLLCKGHIGESWLQYP